MAVVLRLRRDGNRNRPYFRIVAADKRFPRDGRFIEVLGTYDPLKDKANFTVDLEKAEDWISKGAKPSETVASILKRARKAEKAAEE